MESILAGLWFSTCYKTPDIPKLFYPNPYNGVRWVGQQLWQQNLASAWQITKSAQMLDWVCVPIVVETCGNWGLEAKGTFSHLASRLATG